MFAQTLEISYSIIIVEDVSGCPRAIFEYYENL